MKLLLYIVLYVAGSAILAVVVACLTYTVALGLLSAADGIIRAIKRRRNK